MAKPSSRKPFVRYQARPTGCQGKTRYTRQHEAEQAADEIMIMQTDLRLSTYKCVACSTWHLTSQQREVDIN